MIVLGIESSCDETAVAILNNNKLLSHKLNSQILLHQKWGGVVPELASRDHAIRMLPLIKSSLAEAEIELSDIDAFAYTAGPGLIGSLLMGATAACTLAASLAKPVYPVHHLEGHILSALLDNAASFPAIVLLVSGGHSMFILAQEFGDYQILGQSVDDAVGECFDKVAKLIGLGYPGGPIIESLAKHGDPKRWDFPRPMLNSKNMSFSGLKTAVLQAWQQLAIKNKQAKCDLAASFQQAVTDVLAKKMQDVCQIHATKNILLVGGVAANNHIRSSQQTLLAKLGRTLYCPRQDLCTDNGIMIAKAGLERALRKQHPLTTGDIMVKPRWLLIDYLAWCSEPAIKRL